MLPNNRDQLERTKFIEDDDAKVAVRTVFGKGGATIYAVVNTAAAGVQESMVTLFPGPNQIGSVTVSNPVQLATGANYIGLASVNVGNTVNALLQAGSNYIGLASVNVGGSLPALSTGANWIGLATVAIGAQNTVSASFSGNVTLNPSPNFIGLATTVIGSAPTLYAVVNTAAAGVQNSLATLLAGPNQIGSVTVSNPVQLATGANYIGLATVTLGADSILGTGTNNSLFVSSASGMMMSVTLRDKDGNAIDLDGSGNITAVNYTRVSDDGGSTWRAMRSDAAGVINSNVSLSASANYIGLASVNIGGTLPALSAGANYIGLASVNIGGTLPALSVGANYVGLASVNVGGSLPALSTGANYIGLATVIPAYISTYTSFATIASAIGNVTIFTPPASQRFIIKDLIVGALGRNEVAFLSGATILIPLIGLATTSGYIGSFGDNGLRGKATNDALVMNLNSAATVSVMVNVKFEA